MYLYTRKIRVRRLERIARLSGLLALWPRRGQVDYLRKEEGRLFRGWAHASQ